MNYYTNAQIKNAVAAIPAEDSQPKSLRAIYREQVKPGLPEHALRSMLESWADLGRVERLLVGGHRYYRYRGLAKTVAHKRLSGYNQDSRSQSSLDASVDWFVQALYPLRRGQPVLLWLDDPRISTRKNYRGPKKRLVIISPIPMLGVPRGLILISVIGVGSCVLRTGEFDKVADLVLAGIPAKLANVLIEAIKKALKE